MGINGLLPAIKSIAKPTHISAYSGKKVAVDGYSWLHKGVYCCSKELCEGEWTDKYVTYCMSKVQMMRQHGVEPVMIFDGDRLPLKADEEDTRRRSRQENKQKAAQHLAAGNLSAAYECYQRAVDVTPAMAKHLIEVLKSASVAFIVAPYEADAQMAYLARRGDVFAVVTEDSDLLVYGCPRVFFKMDKTGSGEQVLLEDLPHTRGISLAGFTQDMFMQMCILAGCDFLKQLQGVGMKTAHSHMRKFKSFVRVARSLRFSSTSVPRDYEQRFQLAIWVFRHQRVFCPYSRAVVHLNPLPHGGLGAADVEVLAALPEGQEEQAALSFLGPQLDGAVAQGVAEGELDPNSKQPFDLAAIFRGCPRPPPHLQHLLQQEQQQQQQQQQQEWQGSQAMGTPSGPRPGRASWGCERPRVGLSKPRGSGSAKPPLPAKQHGIAQFLTRSAQKAPQEEEQEQQHSPALLSAQQPELPVAKRQRLSPPSEAPTMLGTQDSLQQQLDAEFPISQDGPQQQQQQQQQLLLLQLQGSEGQGDLPSWMQDSQPGGGKDPASRPRGQALSAITLLEGRCSGGSLRRGSGSVCSAGGSQQAPDMGVDSPASRDQEVTSPLRGVQQRQHQQQQSQSRQQAVAGDEVICIDDEEPENRPVQPPSAAPPAQRHSKPRPSSPRLSRFFGKLLQGGKQQQRPRGASGDGQMPHPAALLRSKFMMGGGRQEQQQQQQQQDDEEDEAGAAGSPPDPLEPGGSSSPDCGGGAAAAKDPIHSISHIKQFALLASSAISSVQSSCFRGSQGGSTASQRPPGAAAAKAAAAAAKPVQATKRHGLLSKPFAPPRKHESGGAGKGTGGGAQRKSGAFNKFLFTQA